ncbi:nucleoside recognition domain-containing protein [Edaphocola flava]|uniref:nucleoside recognition domain-containing protein n=1 Tax=Edaphocola flava TaxID=2499629 RepID=UPI00100AF19B|nr:spore maturation protein [Edaphocola flava]
MVLNYVWIGFFLIGFIVALYKVAFLGQMDIFSTMVTNLFDSAKTGFEISIGLTGMMALWLGVMKIGEHAGVVNFFARGVQPFFKTLFRGVPKGHPAYGNIAMNFSANMLGLDNAATPLGLKAMNDLQELNPQKEKASDAQIMFLVLNTAGITLIPSSVIAIRQSMAIEQHIANFNAADIFLPILISTFVAFTAGILITSAFQRINIFKWPVIIFILGFGGAIFGLAAWLRQFPAETMSKYVGLIGSGVILTIIMLFLIAGLRKKLNVYDLFIEGAKEGFTTAIKIIPYLVAMLAAISVFRSSGCMDYLVGGIAFVVAAMGLNTDFVPALPVAFMKPLSGGGARGLMVDVLKEHGVNSFPGKIASIIQGSTETTFYVLAVYFGSINVKDTRYALLCGLLADGIGLITAILVGYLFFH